MNRFLKWLGFTNEPATLTHICYKCFELCDEIISLGEKKEHIYFAFKCTDCNEYYYISTDLLEHKPKFK